MKNVNIRYATVPYFLFLVILSSGLCLAQVERSESSLQTGTLQTRPELGINLAGPADWNTELPFVDVFRLSRTWISQKKGQAWGKGPKLSLDQHGWVKRLESDCWAETLMCTIDGDHYPSGRYTVIYDGVGTLAVSGAASSLSGKPGRMTMDVDASKGTLFFKLLKTNPKNPIRNIRVVMPGFESRYGKYAFHPAFLKRWRGVTCLRFMDWMKTNGSEIQHWGDRPQVSDANYTAKGIPLEVMIDLCNELKADAWFCMPHQADDDYIRQFSQMVKSRLNPKLKVYIEYSNEAWNSMFAQTRYTQSKAKELHLGAKERPWEGGGMYYAQRSVEIFKIWEVAMGGRDRLIRVLAWQSGNTWWMENIVLTHQDAYKHADALAIAPYMGMGVPVKGKGITAQQVAGWSVDQVLDYLEKKSLPDSVESMRKSKEVAKKFGLRLIAYEAGQHMVGVAGGENNEKMTKLFHAANRHPRMAKIYHTYLDAWSREARDLMCHFSSVGKWSKWGSWGVMEYADDDPAKAPKMKAISDWARKNGQKMTQ